MCVVHYEISYCRTLVKIWQVAWVSSIDCTFFVDSTNLRSWIWFTTWFEKELTLCLLFNDFLDRVVRMDASQLLVVSDHLRGNFGCYFFFGCLLMVLRRSRRLIPLGLNLSLFLFLLSNSALHWHCLGAHWSNGFAVGVFYNKLGKML